jgi:N-acetylmuramoyl-L-alanine amidase
MFRNSGKRKFTGMIFLRIIILFFLLALCGSFQPFSQSKFHVKTVVIDAGHGGKDPGCVYGKLYEKDIALSVALELGKQIQNNFSDVKVIYTRQTDTFIELYERAAIANRNKANLFISIHVNSSTSPSSSGTETWVMGPHKSEANLNVAMKENSVIQLEENYMLKYDGFDAKSPEAYIIFSLFQNAYLEQSQLLALKIEELQIKSQRNSRGVKQAGFLVLWKTAMPSVLIETGFISNDEDRTYLASKSGQINLATSIFDAFKYFKSDIEAESN